MARDVRSQAALAEGLLLNDILNPKVNMKSKSTVGLQLISMFPTPLDIIKFTPSPPGGELDARKSVFASMEAAAMGYLENVGW